MKVRNFLNGWNEMELHGSIEDNLRSAVRSAERLRGHPVHADTLDFWRGLLAHARAEKRNSGGEGSEPMEHLIAELQLLVSAHEQG